MKQMTGIDFAEHAASRGAKINNWGDNHLEIQATNGPRKGVSMVISKGPQRPSVAGFIWRTLRWMCLGILLLGGYAVAIRLP